MYADLRCNCCAEEMKRDRGCEGGLDSPFDFEGEEFYQCPVRIVAMNTWAWIKVYRHYTKGHLLLSGGIQDQPAIYLDIMEILESQDAECKEESIKIKEKKHAPIR